MCDVDLQIYFKYTNEITMVRRLQDRNNYWSNAINSLKKWMKWKKKQKQKQMANNLIDMRTCAKFDKIHHSKIKKKQKKFKTYNWSSVCSHKFLLT